MNRNFANSRLCIVLGLSALLLVVACPRGQAQTTTGSSLSGSSGFGSGSTQTGSSSFGGTGSRSFGTSSGSNFGSSSTNTAANAYGTGSRVSTATGSGIGIPSASNPFGSSYANPLGLGVARSTPGTGKTSQGGAFGQPLFGAVAATAAVGGLTGIGTTSNAANGFNTLSMRKAPVYVTTLSDDIPIITHAPVQLQRDLKQVLERSSTLKSRDGIEVAVEESQVVLRGKVASEREKRLAESLIRLTPGVREVQNELQVSPVNKNP